jgi:hypothetical protein
MKTLVVTLMVLAGTAHAQYRPARDLSPFASDVALRWNSHPAYPCPEISAIALTAVDGGDATVMLADGTTAAFKYDGYNIQNQSDVGQILSNSYSAVGSKLFMSLEFNDDGSWPATRLPGFRSLEIYTGVQARSGVYTSQICAYKFL